LSGQAAVVAPWLASACGAVPGQTGIVAQVNALELASQMDGASAGHDPSPGLRAAEPGGPRGSWSEQIVNIH
jgi:hypothetical protein